MSNYAGLSDTIDRVLSQYYASHGRKDYHSDLEDHMGKFKLFVDNGGFEDDAIAEELEGDASECVLVEFDMDDNGINRFPFDPPVPDDNMDEEIFKVLKYIKMKGKMPPRITVDPSFHDLEQKEMRYNVTEEDMNAVVQKYQSLQCFAGTLQGYEDLKFFFAVSEKLKYPFLTYMVDKYTRDNAKYFSKNRKLLSVGAWAKCDEFMIAFKKKYAKQGYYEKLVSAMEHYSKRIMTRLQLNPMMKIKDDLRQICEYIGAMPMFISKIMRNHLAVPPFQVELNIAVKGIESVVSDKKDHLSDDEDDSEADEKRQKENIGSIEQILTNLQNYPVPYHYPGKLGPMVRDTDIDWGDKVVERELPKRELIARKLLAMWHDWRTELSTFDKKHRVQEEDKINFQSDKYPQNRRLSVFVDRRDQNEDEKEDENEDVGDKMVIFQPPNDCNKIENNHVPEIGFELLRRCILPNRDHKGTRNITSETDVGGTLLTFMFNVEQQHEIRSYIVWNGQAMRFLLGDMVYVLQHLFIHNKENDAFIKDFQKLEENGELFVQGLEDESYDLFCKVVQSYK